MWGVAKLPTQMGQHDATSNHSSRRRQASKPDISFNQSDAYSVTDVSETPEATPTGRLCQSRAQAPAMQTPATPQECASMVHAVEEAIKNAQDITPDSGRTVSKMPNLQAWLDACNMQLPTPAAKDLKALAAAAADSNRLRKQLEALREAELELAAREAEENAQNFSMLEEENLSLAADNARLKQQIEALQALTRQAPAARAGRRIAAEDDWVDGVQAKAVLVLQRAEDTRRLSGVYEEEQLVSFRQLNEAEEQLSAVKSLRPGSSQPQQAALQQRLQQAEEEVHAAAAAAQEASRKLELVLEEKEKVQQELQAIKQQLESGSAVQQHAELYQKLVEAHQLMQEEKQQHQRLTGSLLEHAGRLSHKYYTLSDDYGALQKRYHHLASTNEQLALQLKEAHEALYELQAAVQATPPAKRREQQHLLACVADAEQAVRALASEKTQLQDRLLQAQAFIACLQQRPGVSSARGQRQQQQQHPDTPAISSVLSAGATLGATQLCLPAPSQATAAAVQADHESDLAADAVRGAAGKLDSAAGSFDDFVTPVKGRSNPLFDLPPTPASDAHTASAVAHAANFPVEPVSPILAAAAAALTACAGEQQQQQIKWSAASTELQHVQKEQLGLRNEIIKAKSALADIAGQLRATIGSGPAAGAPACAASSTGTCSISGPSAVTASANRGPSNASAVPAKSAGSASRSKCSSSGNGSSSDSSNKSSTSLSGGVPSAKGSASQQSKSSSKPSASGSTRAAIIPSRASTSQALRATTSKEAADASRQSGRQARLTAGRATAAASASKAAAHSTNSQQPQKQHTSSRQEFTFPFLSMSEQQPQVLSASRAAQSAPAAAAIASPCESTGSIGSLGSSQNYNQRAMGQKQAAAAAAAVACRIARILDKKAASPTALGTTGAQHQHAQQLQQQEEPGRSSYGRSACTQGRDYGTDAVLAAESGSKQKAGSGSLSLDQLIADAESVSLEYGVSPGGFSTGNQSGSISTPVSGSAACTPGSAASGMSDSKQAARSAVEQQQLNAAAAAAAALANAFAAPTPGYSGPVTASWATTPESNQGSICFDRHLGVAGGHSPQQLYETPCSAAGSANNRPSAPQATPAESVSDSDVDWLLQQEQERLMHERLAFCLADTPGSASSSAGGGATARLWLSQQQQQPVPMRLVQQAGYTAADLTPPPQPHGAHDMQSAVRPTHGGSKAVAVDTVDASVSPLETHYAETPIGAERVASNILLSQMDRFEDTPVHGNQLQQRSLLTPSFATPTVIADQRAAAAAAHPYSQATADDATSGTRKQDEQEQAEAAAAAVAGGYEHLMALQWMPSPGCTPPLAAPPPPHSPAAAGLAAATGADAAQPAPTADLAAAANYQQTPATSAAAAHSTEPSPLQCAATALLASISPAGLISPGEVVPAHVVKYMTPEWMKQLRQRCQEGTVQVQQLRQQLGLATPNNSVPADASPADTISAQQLCCQEGGLQEVQQLGLGAWSSATVSEASASSASLQQQQDEQHANSEAAVAAALSQQETQLAPGPGASQDSEPVYSAADVIPGYAGAAGCAPAAQADSNSLACSVGAVSARYSIDRLRRRAIAQAAAASAAVTPATAERATEALQAGSAEEEPANACPADLEGAIAALAAAEACGSILCTDSGGSLAQYMVPKQQSGSLQRTISGPRSRSGSGMLYTRPDCPTPGSAYSIASGRESASPDLLLTGLSNSRLMARHLQLQLQHQLDRTASMPALDRQREQQATQRRHSEEVLAAESGDSQQSADVGPKSSAQADEVRSTTAAAVGGISDYATGEQEHPAGTVPGEEQPTAPRATASKAHSQQEAAAAPEAASPLTPGAALNAGAKSCMLSGDDMPHVVAAASPLTPGGMLNAQADSRLLPPSMDLQHVFEKAHDSDGEAAVQTSAADPAPTGACARAARTDVEAADGDAATASALDAAASPDVTAVPVNSIRAHQLSSLTAATLTGTTATTARAASITPLSDARVVRDPTATTVGGVTLAGASVAAADIFNVALCPVHSVRAHELSSATAGTVASVSNVHGNTLSAGSVTPFVSDATGACAPAMSYRQQSRDCPSEATNPSLSSWATPGAAATAAATSASVGFGVAATGPATPNSPPAARSSSIATAVTCTSVRCEAAHIFLGESPTTSRHSGRDVAHTPCTASAATAGHLAGSPGITDDSVASSNSYSCSAAEAAAAAGNCNAGASATPDSCYSVHAPKVSLGDSPQSRCDTTVDIRPVAQQQQLQSACAAAQKQALPGAAAAVAPPVSSTSVAGSSCLYATPATAFESPCVSSSAAGSRQQVFYTAMQQTARSATGMPCRVAAAQTGPVAFGGFNRVVESPAGSVAASACGGNPHGSTITVFGASHDANAPTPASAAAGAASASVVAEDEPSLLQQLLDSPGGSSCRGSPAWGLPAASVQGTSNNKRNAAGCAQQETHEHSTSSAAGRAPEQVGVVCERDIASQAGSVSGTPAGCVSDVDAGSSRVQQAGSEAGTAFEATAAASTPADAVPQNDTAGSASDRHVMDEGQRGMHSPRRLLGPCAHSSTQQSTSEISSHNTSRSSTSKGPSSHTSHNSTGSAHVAAAGQGNHMMSPTLSDLGFIDAPTAADYESAQQLQQQQEEQQQGLEGMTFEQRLALLCSPSSEEGDAQSSHSSDSNQRQYEGECSQGEATCASQSASLSDVQQQHHQEEEEQEEEEEEQIVYTPLLPAYLASRATQTSPQLAEAATQRTGDVRDIETQVTPALHSSSGRSRSKIHPVISSVAAAADSAPVKRGAIAAQATAACDVAASPVKVRDQK